MCPGWRTLGSTGGASETQAIWGQPESIEDREEERYELTSARGEISHDRKKGILKHLAWGGGSDRQRAEFKGIAVMLSSSDFTERPWHKADENIS